MVDLAHYEGILLVPSLREGGTDRAVKLLQGYYQPDADARVTFTGGAWDKFDPSGSRSTSADIFTSDDLVACALLAAPIYGQAAMDLLVHKRTLFEEKLERIGADRDFIDEVATDSPSFAPVSDLFWDLMKLPGVGRTRATKLLARKRPRLVPIVDDVVRATVFNNGGSHWGPLLIACQANGGSLWQRLSALHLEAGLDDSVSLLRVFDVLAWLEGSGKAALILTPEED